MAQQEECRAGPGAEVDRLALLVDFNVQFLMKGVKRVVL
jgi:hypothetical protein